MVGGSVRVLGVALLGIRLSSASAVSGVGDSVGMLKVNSTPPGRGLGALLPRDGGWELCYRG